jgi:tRNA-modifying protein YgfZ
MTPLPFLAVLRVTGPDAAVFLQGQLTNDVRLLADGRTQLTALNTPQGRVVALLRLRQQSGEFYALLPRELADPVVALLRRYVLRAKVDVRVAGDLELSWHEVDSQGDHEPQPHELRFAFSPQRTVVASACDPGIASPGMGVDGRAESAVRERWVAADIAAGLPQVELATSGQFVAQMLNLDRLDGISFAKGCYTGQEIVARTQHLGRIKRRMLRYRLPAGPMPAPLAGLHRDAQKVAEVLMAARAGDGIELLAVVQTEAREEPLRLEDGRVAAPAGLPYELAS